MLSTYTQSRKLITILGRILFYALTIALGFSFALPLLWALSTSLKSIPQVYVHPPIWIPNPLLWRNYPEALTRIPFVKYIINTLRMAFFTVIGAGLSNAVVAYGFSRVRWPGRDFFFFLCISTMMIPYAVTMIPLFITFKELGWLDTYLPLIIPSFFGSPYFIFLLRQFYLTIPQELSDAARVDGCTEFGIMTRIILPLSVPALTVVALFQFMSSWNNYLGPLIYLSDTEKYTVSIGLTMYQSGGWSSANWSYLMAASVITIVPILIMFFFTQRTFIEGITLTGIKG